MQRAPVKPERAILEANMGGDKKPSAEFFQSGHGKTVLAEAFLSDEQIRRVLRTTAEDLEALSWAGTHGSVASGMQSVAFTPASAIAAIFAATGQDLGMVGTSSMAHGTARRVDGGLQATIRFGGLEVGTVGGGTTLPSARDWLASIGCAGAGKVYRFAQIVAAAALCARDQRLGRDGDRRQRELLQGAPRTRRPAVIALVFRYDARDPEELRARRTARTASGRSSSAQGAGYIGTELLRDVEEPDRYLVIDRWESVDAYNAFLAEHQAEYLRRSDESRFYYIQELRFGTFENIWHEHDPAAP